MSPHSFIRKLRWELAIPGLLLLFVSAWLHPGSLNKEWSDNQWKRSLSYSNWSFSRLDGTLISNHLTLAPFGVIQGYAHPNESKWKVRDHTLIFVNQDGRATSRFPLGARASLTGLTLTQQGGGMHMLAMNSNAQRSLRHLSVAGMALALALLSMAAWLPRGLVSAQVGVVREKLPFITGRRCAFGSLVLWFLVACTTASMPAYVPDEAWFLFEALASGKAALDGHDTVRQLLFHQNAFGYGGIWWSIYTAFALAWHGLFDMYGMPAAGAMLGALPDVAKVELWEYASPAMVAPMVMMRILALSSLAAFGTLVLRKARTGSAAVLATLVLVTMPIAWWSGKLASPELFAAALFAIAVLNWFLSGRALLALLLASAALGMKLTIAPVYLVFVCFISASLWQRPDRRLRTLAGYGLACIGIFVVCNSWLLYDPRSGIEQLLHLSRTYSGIADLKMQSALILTLHSEMWEGTTYGSLAYWSGSAGLLVVSLVLAFGTNRRLGAFLLTGGLAQYLFMLTQPWHAWYWFPVILSAVIPFSQLQPRTALFTGVLLLASLSPFDYMRREWSYKTLHLQEIEEVARERSCLLEKLNQYQPDVVYDMVAIGSVLSRSGAGNWKSVNFHDSYVRFFGAPRVGEHPEKQILLLGERSRQNLDLLRSRSEVPENVLGACGSVTLIRIDD